ncbi:MAG: hypothetical protein KTR31_30150 [Myxococcales bacterium]|nr:hypothetical protein [Myxococcales bacterium]
MTTLIALAVAAQAQPAFLQFETGPVRPVALSPDGSLLFVANVTDGHLQIYDVVDTGLWYRGAVPVGLDPVSVAARTDDEVWVVNHLSDSVSVVDVDELRVSRTLLVGDEPRDVVFAQGRAFVTTAHRGQHRTDPSLAAVPGAGDPQLTTPGVGRADVWVFDAEEPGAGIGGTPEAILQLFGDTPRALAVSPDGATVYAAVFQSGNRTTALPEGVVCDGFEAAGPCFVEGFRMPGGNPGPAVNVDKESAPEVGLIVRYDDTLGFWADELGRDWSNAVRFDLPDQDLFAIDAATLEPASSPVTSVGTVLFNMAVNPVSGALYVTNTEARNEVRFEGPGIVGGSTVQGRLHEARVTVVQAGQATPRHLNPHIDYAVTPAEKGTKDHSLATPVDVVVSADGATLYVAAYGSARVGVISTAELEDGSFDPSKASASYLSTGGGPSGLALSDDRGWLFVYTRFDHAIAVIDVATGAQVDRWALHTPEPDWVREGRPFLYDAQRFSSNGEASCASCHVFGDLDHLAWDLGNPDEIVTTGSIPTLLGVVAPGDINGTGNPNDFHPMKGPMTTQTLRGMQHHGAMHWRGDRAVGTYGDDPFDERLSFKNFVVAFPGLLGMRSIPNESEMDAFAAFTESIAMPPNPLRALDRSLTTEQQDAFDFYVSSERISDGVPIGDFGFNCDGCHSLEPADGFFGTAGLQSFENEPQIMKVPQLRNLYTKVGMFGMIDVDFTDGGSSAHTGDQIRGYGFLHDGSIDTLFRFFSAVVFDANGPDIGFRSDAERRAMVELMMAFDNDIAPVVGQQITLTASDDVLVNARMDLLLASAERPFVSKLLGGEVTDCDVVAKAWSKGRVRGFLYEDGAFTSDDGTAPLSVEELRALADGGSVTLTAVLPGDGHRLGIDRDGDGVLDGLDSCPYEPNAEDQDTGCSDTSTKSEPPQDTGTPPTTDTGTGTAPTDGSPVEPVEPIARTGCGCDASGSAPWAFVGVGLLLGLCRRRQ